MHAGKKMAEYVDSNNKLNDVQSWAVVKSCKIHHNWPVSFADFMALSACPLQSLSISMSAQLTYLILQAKQAQSLRYSLPSLQMPL